MIDRLVVCVVASGVWVCVCVYEDGKEEREEVDGWVDGWVDRLISYVQERPGKSGQK